MPTQGFQLSQFSRAPQVPGDIGQVDVKGIYDSVVNSLRAHEAMQATAGRQEETAATQLFNTQKANLGTQEALAAMPGVGDAALATRNKNILSSAESTAALPGVGPLAGARTSVAGDIVSGNQEKAIERKRNAELLQQAQAEELQARGEISNAINLADHGTRANDLSQIRVKYPWLSLPQYKDLSGVLDAHMKSALSESEKAKDRELAQETGAQRAQTAVEIAKTRASSGGSPSVQLLRRRADIMEALENDPDNPTLESDLLHVEQMINKLSATAPVDPSRVGDKERMRHVEKLNKARSALSTMEAKTRGVEANIEKAMKLASGWSVGLAAPLLENVPTTDANEMAALVESIGSNIGFDALSEMRQNSPTGGALGNVSDYEGRTLQSTIDRLSTRRSKAAFLGALQNVRDARREALRRAQEAYERDVESFGPRGTAADAAPATSFGGTPAGGGGAASAGPPSKVSQAELDLYLKPKSK